MPRRTAQRKRIEKRAAAVLVGLLLFALLTVLTITVPGFTQWAWRLAGITTENTPPPNGSASPVAVHVIDVGQGDAVLLEAGGEFALIDAGPPEGEAALLAYLEGAGVDGLRYVFMTHPHADHIGGMQAVIEAHPVGLVVLPDLTLAPYPTTRLFEDLLAAMLETGAPAETAAIGAEYPLGGGVVRVVHAGVETPDNYNLLSVGLLFEAGGLRFLDTGDGEAANERAMLEGGENLAADIFLAGHHGSNTSNKDAFVEAVAPRFVVISCAAGNSYGHPHRTPLAAYEAAGATVLRTDRQGNVVIRPDGSGGLAWGVERNAG